MDTLQDGRQLWHTPLPDAPTDAQQALSDFRLGATKTLLIVDYSFNMQQVVTEIETLLQKGVQVTCILDKSQSKTPTEVPVINALQVLKSYSNFILIIGTSNMKKIIHDKFMVRDGVDTQYGSFNYTLAAGKEDNFFFIELNSEVANDLTVIADSIKSWILQNEPQ